MTAPRATSAPGPRWPATRVGLWAACLAGLAMIGCKPGHNMEKQPYYRPYSPSESFIDGMSERPLVAGVVPRPVDQSPGIPYVAVRFAGPAGYDRVPPSAAIPIPIDARNVQRGQMLFTIYCSVCHGRLGNGQGMIVQRGFTPPPSFHLERLRNAPDAHFYDVITNGYNAMFSYSERVAPDDRWRIVAYIRALQTGVERAKDQLSEKDRRALSGSRP